jgi:hypothetical protein
VSRPLPSACWPRRTGRVAAIVIVDHDSNVTDSYQEERPVEAVLELLERR